MIGFAKLPSREECGGCRSGGSNIHPSSQSQKMSIGVVVDSAHRVRHKPGSIAQNLEPIACHQTPIHQTHVDGIPEEQCQVPILEIETNIPGQERPTWISTKDKPSALKTLVHENQSSKTISKAKCKLNGFSENAANSAKRKNQDLNAVNCKTTPGGAEEPVHDKITEDKSIKRPSDTLKMKLLEILGSDALPDEDKESNDNQDQTINAGSVSGIHVNNQKTHIKEAENFMDGTVGNHVETPFEKNVNDVAFQSGLNSDPIETDSESPNNIIKRPVTHSLKRRGALPKSSPKKADKGLCPSFWKMNNHTGQTGGKKWSRSKEPKSTLLISGVKKAAVKGARIEPRKISFVEKNDVKEKASTYTKRTRNSLDKTAGLGDKNEDSPLNDRDQTIPEITLHHKGFHQNTSPAKTASLGGRGECHQHGPANDKESITPELGTRQRSLPLTSSKKGGNSVDETCHTKENEELHESFGPSKKIFKQQENLQSPITRPSTPVESPSPLPTGKIDQVRGSRIAAVEEENIFRGVQIRNFGDWQISRPRCNSPKLLAESSDDAEEKEVDPADNSPTTRIDKSAPEHCSPDSSEENSLAEERYDGVSKKKTISSPEVYSDRDSAELFLRRGKRPRYLATRFDKKSKASPPQKDSTYEEDDVLCVPFCQDEDDSLSRAVTMLAVALKKLKSRIKSATRKKSSEILHSTAEGLNLHLQQVKSLIQTDLEKVTSIGKSKRKHVETMFQDQQEQLKTFHENFRKGLIQHIQDIISSTEEMETDQAELKGLLEKQKAQHKKILLQVEEEMESQLNEVHKRISNVHKVANEKLLQLKYVIAECLK